MTQGFHGHHREHMENAMKCKRAKFNKIKIGDSISYRNIPYGVVISEHPNKIGKETRQIIQVRTTSGDTIYGNDKIFKKMK